MADLLFDVGAVCTREVVIARGGDTVLDVARLMRAHHVGDVVIVETREGVNYPTGILTDRDIVIEGVAEVLDRLPQLLAEDLIIRPLVTVAERDAVDHAVEIMRNEGVRRLPVVDDRGALVGLLALDDLLDLSARRLASLAAVVTHGERRERFHHP